jgi:arylsulfatase A-like enzyme
MPPVRTTAPIVGDRREGARPVASAAPDAYDARAVKANYYAMIRLIDDQLGRILDSLRDTGQLGRTIIVFMSDHGEMLGDHGLILKGCRFFEGLVHVPLIVSWPEGFRQGEVSEALVELVDIAPTLLEAAGLAVPEAMQGRSLAPILTGAADPHRHKAHVVCEYHDAIEGQPDHTHGSMVFDGRYKTAVYHGHAIESCTISSRTPANSTISGTSSPRVISSSIVSSIV